MSVSPEEYRTLLSRFASGVTVATALDAQGRPHGMTASAVCSVSLEPPILLVSVDRTAHFHPIIAAAPRFALNVLAEDQEVLSRRFAAEVDDRFEGIGWEEHQSGLPLLHGVVAHILCRRVDQHEVGDHTVFFGAVEAGAVFPRAPLIHFRGGYAGIASAREPV